MIRHILKIMWNQRRSNGWIFAELAVVAAVLWMMIDTFWVDYRTYHAPLGFDIGNVWRFKLSDLDAKAPGYVPDSLYHSSDPEDLTRLMTQIRQNPEVSILVPIRTAIPGGKSSRWMATRSMRPIWSRSKCAMSHRNISAFSVSGRSTENRSTTRLPDGIT